MMRTFIDHISDRLTEWVGSTSSLIVHTVVFALAFSTHWLLGVGMDYVLLVLTTFLSIEAIYIAIFIQRSVNQQGERLQDVEDSIDDVEEALDDVEEALDDVEETLTETEEDIADLPADTLREFNRPLEELAEQMKQLVAEFQEFKAKSGDKE